jgi:hypothetical protein
VWGTLHGGALAVTRMWQRARAASGASRAPSQGLLAIVAPVATFHFVCLGWLFFRAPTLAHAGLALAQLGRGGWTLEHVTSRVVLVLAVAGASHVVPRRWEVWVREAFVMTPAVVQGLVLAALAMALHLAAAAKPEPFVYGQF